MKRFGRRKRKNTVCFLILMLLIIVPVCLLAETVAGPVIKTFALSAAENQATMRINECVSDYFNEFNIQYADIAQVDMDAQQHVTSIKVNTTVVNQIRTDVISKITAMFSDVQIAHMNLPLGSLTGSNLLAGKGIAIPFSVSYTATAQGELVNLFVTRGINQTQHQIILKIVAELQVLSYGKTESVTIDTQITVAETVIVGVIPEIYAGADDELWPNLIEE